MPLPPRVHVGSIFGTLACQDQPPLSPLPLLVHSSARIVVRLILPMLLKLLNVLLFLKFFGAGQCYHQTLMDLRSLSKDRNMGQLDAAMTCCECSAPHDHLMHVAPEAT